MLRAVVECSKLILESPSLMLLGLVVMLLAGGLLMPVLAAKLRRSKFPELAARLTLIEPVATNSAFRASRGAAKCDFISFVPSDGKLH